MTFKNKIEYFANSNSFSIGELAGMCGMTQPEFSRYKNMGSKPTFDKMSQFYDAGISASWLHNNNIDIKKSYDMFADNENGHKLARRYSEMHDEPLSEKFGGIPIKSAIASDNDIQLIPVYDVNAQAGTLLFPDDPSEIPIDYIRIPGVKADGAIVVHGDSMYPEYQPGDMILVRKITENFIQYGRAFLVCTKEQRVIKYLFQSDISGSIILKSCNERYPDLTMEREEIVHLYIIIGKFREEVV